MSTNNYTSGKQIGSVSGFVGVLSIIIMVLLGLCFFFGIIGSAYSDGYKIVYPFSWLSIVFWAVAVVSLNGFKIIGPNQTVVFTFFGTPVGVLQKVGFHWFNPLYMGQTISNRTTNHDSEDLKVNDSNGTPIITSATIRWRIVDAELVTFELEDDAETFITTQSEGNLRSVVSNYPYEVDAQSEDAENAVSLSKSAEEVGKEIAAKINEDVKAYGIEVDDVLLNSLSYAPEVAAAMTQKQQAQAVLNSKKELAEGITDVVKTAIYNLEQDTGEGENKRSGIKLTDDTKGALATNLTLVLYGSSSVDPVINVNS